MGALENIADQINATDTQLFAGATFFPDDSPDKWLQLQERVFQVRYAAFVAACMEVHSNFPKLAQRTGFPELAFEILDLAHEDRVRIINAPEFQIWLRRTLTAMNEVLVGKMVTTHKLRKEIDEFSVIYKRLRVPYASEFSIDICGKSVPVQRFDIDSTIARATFPSYTFPKYLTQRKKLEKVSGYPLAFFHDIACVALGRIQKTWPEYYQQFANLVQVIGYLPDAEFRSCSASRYTGVIYLSAKDSSLIDVEESLVHEAAHQLLYYIVEVQAIADPDTPVDDMYTLPWSGRQRDFYGYFHAFFIYIALVKYYERVSIRPEYEQKRAQHRMVVILSGLIKALPDFEGNRYFTVFGHELFGNLKKEVLAVQLKYDALLTDTTNDHGHAKAMAE
jgi:hypothetical protein